MDIAPPAGYTTYRHIAVCQKRDGTRKGPTMNCPKCNEPMATVTYEDIEVDRCTGCRGIWFDMLEADHLKEMKGSEALDDGDPAVGRKFNEVDRIDCPRCEVEMLRMVDSRQRHIWLEACPVCYGIFFDAGEFRDFKEETVLDFLRDLWAKERR